MKKIIKDTLILFAITIIAGFALGLVYDITKEPIAYQNQLKKDNAYKAVCAGADTFATLSEDELAAVMPAIVEALGDNTYNTIDEVSFGYAGSELVGYIITVSNAEAYGGTIQMTVGISDGTVTGLEVLAISETPGLGMKAAESSFTSQFVGDNVDAFVYTKSGAAAANEIDAITSATYTTKSMTNGVNAALSAYKVLSEQGIGGASNE